MNKKDLCKIIGKNIQNQRKLKGYTQETFAELMSVSWSYVSKLEAGLQNLTVGKILEISEFLNVDIQNLLNIKN